MQPPVVHRIYPTFKETFSEDPLITMAQLSIQQSEVSSKTVSPGPDNPMSLSATIRTRLNQVPAGQKAELWPTEKVDLRTFSDALAEVTAVRINDDIPDDQDDRWQE